MGGDFDRARLENSPDLGEHFQLMPVVYPSIFSLAYNAREKLTFQGPKSPVVSGSVSKSCEGCPNFQKVESNNELVEFRQRCESHFTHLYDATASNISHYLFMSSRNDTIHSELTMFRCKTSVSRENV